MPNKGGILLTSQEKKQYLLQYGELDDYINEKCNELAKWRDLATKITPNISDMPTASSVSDKIGTAVTNIVFLESVLNGEIDRLCDMRAIIEDGIHNIQDIKLQRVLYLAYIGKRQCDGRKAKRLKLWEVANELNYSLDWVKHLHGEALFKLILKDNTSQHHIA